MNKTNSNKEKATHYELSARMDMQDLMVFSYFMVDREYYRMKNSRHIILRIIAAFAIYPPMLAAVTIMNLIYDSDILVYVLSIVCGFLFSFAIFSIKKNYPEICGMQSSVSIANSTCGFKCKEPRELFFNLGKKGFSTNANKNKEICFYRYKDVYRAIECEYGIVMILGVSDIVCIPARSLDADSACFLIKKLRRKLKKQFITDGRIRIGEHITVQDIMENTTERNENK